MANRDWLNTIFHTQEKLQKSLHKDIPSVVNMYNSATAMVVEVGEMLQEDTRWKRYVTGSMKTPKFNFEAFKEELADVFIYFMNICIYSGVDCNMLKEEVANKLAINIKRFGGNNETSV